MVIGNLFKLLDPFHSLSFTDYHDIRYDTIRFIPNRDGIDLHTSYQLLPDGPSTPTKGKRKASGIETDAQKGGTHCLLVLPKTIELNDRLLPQRKRIKPSTLY
jgi:hypothetical protein